MANHDITIKRWGGVAWDSIYPKTTIPQVINLSSVIANMQAEIDDHDNTYIRIGQEASVSSMNVSNMGNNSSLGIVFERSGYTPYRAHMGHGQLNFRNDNTTTNQVSVTKNSRLYVGPYKDVGNPSEQLTVGGAAKIEGILNMNNQRITSVATPTAGTDAANRNYVDDEIDSRALTDPTFTGVPKIAYKAGEQLQFISSSGVVNLRSSSGRLMVQEDGKSYQFAVLDDDPRLTNSRPASDVSAWAKKSSLAHTDIPYATQTTRGAIKVYESGGTLYIETS